MDYLYTKVILFKWAKKIYLLNYTYPAPSSKTPSAVNGLLPVLVETNLQAPGKNLLFYFILSNLSNSSYLSYGSGMYSIFPNKLLIVVLPNPFFAGFVKKFLAFVITSPEPFLVLNFLSSYSFICSNSECLL